MFSGISKPKKRFDKVEKNLKKMEKKLKYFADDYGDKLFEKIAPSVAIIEARKRVEFCSAEELQDAPNGPTVRVTGFVVFSKKNKDGSVCTLTLSAATMFQVMFEDVGEPDKLDDIRKQFEINIEFFQDNHPYKAEPVMLDGYADFVVFNSFALVSPLRCYSDFKGKIPRGLPLHCITHHNYSGESFCFITGQVSHLCSEYMGEDKQPGFLFFMHMTPLNSAATGAPLFTKRGVVFGMHSHVFAEGITSFAVPLEVIKFDLVSASGWSKQERRECLKLPLDKVLQKMEEKGEFDTYFGAEDKKVKEGDQGSG